MMRLRMLTGAIALGRAFGLTGAAVADPLASGRNSQFAVAALIIDVGGVADCADADDDSQCDRGVAFITKSGFWGVRIQGVELNGAGPLPVCLTEFGYLSPDGYPPLPDNFSWGAQNTVAEQAAWLAEGMQLARGLGWVRMAIIWNVNFTKYDTDPQGGFAIMRPDGTCPACDTLAGLGY